MALVVDRMEEHTLTVSWTTWEANCSQEHSGLAPLKANRRSSGGRRKIWWQGPPGAKEPVTEGMLGLRCSAAPVMVNSGLKIKCSWLCSTSVSFGGLEGGK